MNPTKMNIIYNKTFFQQKRLKNDFWVIELL